MSDHSSSQETFSLPVGTVTFLLTDIAGSTRLWESDSVGMAKAVARHYELLADAVGRHGGVRPVEQGEGDSIVAAFSRASDALAAAFDVQRAIGAERWPDGIDLQVRIALHAGEAQLRDEGNYFGQTVIRCARLRALAHGGQVVVSRAVHDLVADRLPPGVVLRDLGSHRLRDLGRPEQVFQLWHPGLLAEFPPLVSLDAVPNNLPAQLSSFVGREREMREIHELLDQARLVTLTGSGGCGKTRLALQVAVERLDEFPDGVWYVELAPLGETTSVARTVASVLNLSEEPERPIVETLVDRLRDLRLLLIVDNCEHLLAECASVVERVLHTCAGIHVLATSRALLNVDGETPWRVPSLGLPADGEPAAIDVLTGCDAVRLFVERATRSRPNFVVTGDNASVVAEVCRRLDGIPLAIELAAARIRVMAPDQILRGLDDRFRLLTGGSRTLLPRQQTLRASVDWSHHLLNAQEQTLLRRLSTFAGGFTLDAAEAVGAADDLDAYEVLDVLTQLVDRSLVQVDDLGADVRYRMLETIKQYAREQLEAADEQDATRDRHLGWFVRLADQARPGLIGREQSLWLSRLEADHDNLRAALEWAAASFAVETLLRTAVDLTFFWFLAGHFQEGNGWLERALRETHDEPSTMRARARWGLAYLNFYAGSMMAALDTAQDALAWGEAAGDDLTIARSLDTMASIQQLNDPVEALATLQEAARRARVGGDDWCLTDALQKASWCFLYRDCYDDMQPLLEESGVLVKRLGNPFFVAYHHVALSWIAVRRGDVEEARAQAAVGRAAADQSLEPVTIAFGAIFQAEAELLAGEYDRADQVLAACQRGLTRRGVSPLPLLLVALWLGQVRLATGDLASAQAIAQEAVGVFEAEQLNVGVVTAAPLVAEAIQLAGPPNGARPVLSRLLECASAIDDPRFIGVAHRLLACADRFDGEQESGESHAHEGLALFTAQGMWPDVADTLDVLACLAADGESWSEAVRLVGAVDATRAARGWARWPVRQHAVDETLHAARGALSEADYSSALEEGGSMSLDAAIAYARRARGTRGRPTSGWRSLTPTELEVVRLVAEGLTNPQIGERLFIARGTVKVHLSHIFTKLAIATRSELASEATRRHL
ncbi:MAG: helix-turn-helix transcriptional regulator [Acidimicrobiales bacterium]